MIYLDYQATTPVAPEAAVAMRPWIEEKFANPHSPSRWGSEAAAAVEAARGQVAAHLPAGTLAFTAGATEALNWALKGTFEISGRRKLVTVATEHAAVLDTAEWLRGEGAQVVTLPVGKDGLVDLNQAANAIDGETALVAAMLVNNEIGVLQPVAELARLARDQGALVLCDAVQGFARMPLPDGPDFFAISGHKIHGPKGIGALYVRRGVRLQPQNIGGHQERDIRGGTEPVPNLVAFGEACEIAAERMERDAANAAVLREQLEQFIGERVAECHFNGDRNARLPNIANISFGSIEGEGLLINLDMQGIAVSTGSACSSGTLEPSPVIRAIGRGDDLARGAIRFSFGRFNTEADLERLMEILPSSIETLRKLNPTQMKKAV